MQLELFVLKSFAAAALAAAGMRRPDAVLAAEALVRTEARGILSHGLRQLPRYVNAMQAGGIDPRGVDAENTTLLTWGIEVRGGEVRVMAEG